MRIVHVKDTFLPTAGYQINFLPKWNLQHKHEVYIVCSDAIKYWTQSGMMNLQTINLTEMDKNYYNETGVKVYRIHSFANISGRAFVSSRIFDLVESLKPDVVMVHLCDSLTAMRFFIKSKYLSYQIVSDCHMVEIASQNRFREIFRWFYKHFFTPIIIKYKIPIIAVEEESKSYCINHYKIPDNLLPVITLGTDTDLFKPDNNVRIRFRKELGINEDAFVCVTTGRFTEDKKALVLAEAFTERFPVKRDVILLMVGTGKGEYYEKVITLLQNSKNRIITFPPQEVRDLVKFFQIADLAVWAGASTLSFYEAQACGLPVLMENLRVNADRMVYNNGFVCESTALAFRDKIIQYLNMPYESLISMGENGRRLVLESKSYDTLAQKVEKLFNEVIVNGAKRS